MDFTREPIIETVITPRDGCTLVIRSSKGSGQEEYFVDALEVVIFGNAIFFRSRERPKAFLVPATDYEVLEVRETRLVLKNVGLDRSIKIAGGREASLRTAREPAAKLESQEQPPEKLILTPSEGSSQLAAPAEIPPGAVEAKLEGRIDKKRDRRRNYRRRRGRDEEGKVEPEGTHINVPEGTSVELPPPELSQEEITASASSPPVVAVLSSLLAPPPNLISETIARYKDNALFKGAFFLKDEESDLEDEGELEETAGDEEGYTTDVESEGGVPAIREQALFEGEYEDAEGLKHEDIEVEVPSMSLDYPVYVPHERVASEEPFQNPIEESSQHTELHFEEPRSEEISPEVFAEEPVSEGPPLMVDRENEEPGCDAEMSTDSSTHNEAYTYRDDSDKPLEDHH